MARSTDAAPSRPSNGKACKHHWIIETATGPTSTGVCKLCGAVKEFQNYWHGSSWERDVPKSVEITVSVSRDIDDHDDY